MKGALPVSFSYRDGEQTHSVYTVDEIKRYDHKFLHSVRNGTKSIQKYLPENSYFLAIMSKRSNCYIPSTNLQRAKLLLKSKWVHENVLQNVANNEVANNEEPAEIETSDQVSSSRQTEVITSTAVQDVNIIVPRATTPSLLAPPLFELNDDEKFRNAEGNPVNIETRGVRSPRGIFFRVVDVSREFGIRNLKNTLLHPNPSFERTRDFVTFTVLVDSVNLGSKANRSAMFLTYIGMLRVLFVTRNKNTEVFHEWASERLFASHLGDRGQRASAAAQLLGVPYQSIIDVYDTCSISVSCVYLFILGTVRDLRASMFIPDNFPDDSLVGKYGKTEDLKRRTTEHYRDYGAIQNSQLILAAQAWVDPINITEAENRIRAHFEHAGYKLKSTGKFVKRNTTELHEDRAPIETLHNNTERQVLRNELVVIPSNQLKHIKAQFADIQTIHSGRIKDAIEKIARLENEVMNMEQKHALSMQVQAKEIEVQKKETEMQKKETEMQKRETEMQKRETEMQKRETEMMAERVEFHRKSHMLQTTILEQEISTLKSRLSASKL